MKKITLWLLKFYADDYRFRIKVSSVLEEGVRSEYHEQTEYGCLYEGIGEYLEGNEAFKVGDKEIIKRGIEKQIDISHLRIKEENNI